MNPEITVSHDHLRSTMAIITEFDQGQLMREGMSGAIFAEICRLVAERYVAENFQAIAAVIDPNAIANLAVAEAAGVINKTLHEKMPDKVLEIHKRTTEVYQRGILGGLERIV